MGKLTKEQRKALRLERLQKKAEEAGVTPEQFKKDKRAARVAKLAKEAEKVGLTVGKLKKKNREERRQQFLKEQEEARKRVALRKEQGPLAPPEVIAPAGVTFERSKDPLGDFCKRHKDEPANKVMSIAMGVYGGTNPWSSKNFISILKRMIDLRPEEMKAGGWLEPWIADRLKVKSEKEEEEEEPEVVIVKDEKAVEEVAHSKPKKVKGKIARK